MSFIFWVDWTAAHKLVQTERSGRVRAAGRAESRRWSIDVRTLRQAAIVTNSLNSAKWFYSSLWTCVFTMENNQNYTFLILFSEQMSNRLKNKIFFMFMFFWYFVKIVPGHMCRLFSIESIRVLMILSPGNIYCIFPRNEKCAMDSNRSVNWTPRLVPSLSYDMCQLY